MRSSRRNNEISYFDFVGIFKHASFFQERAAFNYLEDGKSIGLLGTGANYDEFLSLLTDDARIYGYIRVECGDEMSRRAKFAFITWIGSAVSALKKAKVSTDKAFVKQICNNFSVEIFESDITQLQEDKLVTEITKAGGANYGTGVRD